MSAALSRRKVLTIAAGALAAVAGVPRIDPASAAAAATIHLEAPENADNGSSVPLKVWVNMPGNVHVSYLILIAEKNQTPLIGVFYFSPHTGVVHFATRLRLRETQDIMAVAMLSDGSYLTEQITVIVSVGACE